MRFSTIVAIPALLAAQAMAQGTAYIYQCYNCECNASGEGTFHDNDGTNGVCLDLDQTAASSVGLKGSSFHCTLYQLPNCQGNSQNIGIHSGQTWGCTNAQNFAWASSLKCWTR